MVYAINSYDHACIDAARLRGFGLEVDAYLLPVTPEEEARLAPQVEAMVQGFALKSFHGTMIARELEDIHAHSPAEQLAAYQASWALAARHGIDTIVFHANYWAQRFEPNTWVAEQAAFWKDFLKDKPSSLKVYLENYIDDMPALLAALCDAVDDPRLGICLDTGHARCNSNVPVSQWIRMLGKRIGHVHLHNNDGLSDRHWPPDRGVLDMRAVLDGLLGHASPEMVVLECDYTQSVGWLMQEGRIS